MLRSMLGPMAIAALGAVAMGAAPGAARAADAGDDAGLRRDLQALARRAVLFGHQSVGMNVLDGLKRLAARAGVPLRIEDVSKTAAVPPSTFAHTWVAANGTPEPKLEAFQRALSATAPGSVEIALVKFCYVDFTADTDAKALFARYQAAADAFRKAQPGVVLVHVTVPLTTVEGGWKSLAKRMMGRTEWGRPQNARRETFNALLRETYQGKEPIFDLALVESTRPDGTREITEYQGRPVPALVAAYTPDDGHLNEEGQDRAARALVSALAQAEARLPARPAP